MKLSEDSAIPSSLTTQLRQAADQAARGVCDLQDMREACEEMDRLREEMRHQAGKVSIAVDLIRECRDEA